MKKVIAFLGVFSIIALMTVSAQSFKYTVKTTADCTNRTVDFTVPAEKVAKLMSLEIVPKWTSCNESQPAPSFIFVKIYKAGQASSGRTAVLYKKTVNKEGHVTELVPIQDVKLNPGTYTMEVSRAQNTEATLEIFISAN
ncbi:MAG: hypothetical protein C0592_08145 [Marinilabiliales bacterium]|nr:MAG: hypothetical protein C0592_08145 [Marinilabiliales bacterium]